MNNISCVFVFFIEDEYSFYKAIAKSYNLCAIDCNDFEILHITIWDH